MFFFETEYMLFGDINQPIVQNFAQAFQRDLLGVCILSGSRDRFPTSFLEKVFLAKRVCI